MADSFASTLGRFIAGGMVTAIFSGSLVVLARNGGLEEVLLVGMVVPSFTWMVQLSASAALMLAEQRQVYWGELARACLLGSVALLPAAMLNLCLSQSLLWISAANVLASVTLMGATLYRRTTRQGISPAWPISWGVTICFNMGLFVWASRRWW